MLKKLTALSGALLLTACGHGAIISPLPQGQYDVMSMGRTESATTADAIDGAKETCANFVVLDKKVKYQGVVSERMQRTLNTVSKAVPLVGMAASNGSSLNYYGNPIQSNEDYVVNLRIQCPNLAAYQHNQSYGYQPQY